MRLQSQNLRLFITLLATSTVCCFAAGTQSDYDRAGNLSKLLQNKVFRANVEPHWQADNHTFWYQVQTDPACHEFIMVDAEKGYRRTAFDHEKMADSLNANGIKNAQANSLQIDNLTFSPDNASLQFNGYGKTWRCNLETYALTEVSESPVQSLPAYLPDHAPQPPHNNGKRINLTFVNDTDKTVQLFWLRPDGEKTSYGKIEPKQQYAQSTYANHVWLVCDLESNPLAVYQADDKNCKAVIGVKPIKYQPNKPAPNNNKVFGLSPDGTWRVFLKNHNLWLHHISTKKEFALSHDGTQANVYTRKVYWSPDSKKLLAVQTQKAPPHTVYMVESSPKDQLQPKLHSIDYPKPGDILDIDQPRLFDVPSKKQIPIDNTLFNNPWSISYLQWAPDSETFSFVYNQRGHQVLRIVSVNAQTGTPRTLFEETSKTFIDYSGKFFYQRMDQTNEIIWMSERDGWNHLYRFDAITGQCKNQVTKGNWVVRHVDKVDEEKRQIWFRAGGVYPKQDPYYLHYCRVNFDGTGFTILTEGDGTHEITFSPDREYFVDKYSRVDMPPVHELRRSKDGQFVCLLEQADWSRLLKTGWQTPERFVAKGRDGTTDIYGVIIRPTNFDPNKSYPIIEYIYAGPQSAFVPKSFISYTRMNKMAELGFILVQIDGMGTSHRSKQFHDVCWQNLSDAGFPDRIKWIQAAAQQYPYMDISRIGIYGGSAGGQNAATAVMTHGDFYKAAAADCGCHDNRMDKVWWNEQWMGWPVGPHYEANSNVTLAPGLQGKLLLTVGELDKNVDPASTMQVVDALIKADKDFDILVIPGAGHGAGGGKYASRRRADFFVRHLLGVEPRSE